MRSARMFAVVALVSLFAQSASATVPGGVWRWWGFGYGDGYHAVPCGKSPWQSHAHAHHRHVYGANGVCATCGYTDGFAWRSTTPPAAQFAPLPSGYLYGVPAEAVPTPAAAVDAAE